jgi:hypothetical protein
MICPRTHGFPPPVAENREKTFYAQETIYIYIRYLIVPLVFNGSMIMPLSPRVATRGLGLINESHPDDI